MDLSALNLSDITWQRFFLVAFTVAGVDFVVSVLAAVTPPNYFDWAKVAQVLDTHILKRVIPITALAFIALSFPAGPQHDLLWVGASGALALYVGETVKSIASSIGFAKAVAKANSEPDTLDDGPEEILPGVPS